MRRRRAPFRAPLACALLSLLLPVTPVDLVSGAPASGEPPLASSAGLVLEKGDHVSIIGSALAERMQHDGWLEALIQSRFPGHELVFRNLAFSGDEVAARQRSEGFGSPDDYLGANETDVILAFFGFNESFAGEGGLEKFKKALEKLISDTRAKKYNGKSAPRLVLFSPIAHEDLKDPDLPDGSAANARLALYTKAIAEAAAAGGALFVDLFGPTLDLYGKAVRPLTMNGVHLSSEGNRRVAEIIEKALFPESRADTAAAERDEARLEKVRAAVVEKSFYWFNRYRATDGYNIFGGRSGLKYTDDLSNRTVLAREMEILDAMTARRDRRVWAAARGEDLAADDTGLPEPIPVKTNKKGAGPEGQHLFLSGEEAISKMKMHEGMEVGLFASEERFPELANPVQMAFDPRGRLWVAAWPSYPHWHPREAMHDKLLILEDADGDGKADVAKTFAGDLHDPTGFEFWGGGVILAMAPDLIFLEDTDGDDRADVRRRILHGLGSEDTHHTANSFALDPGGALYFGEGVFHRTQIETPYGPVRNHDACIWRFVPRTWRVERHIPYGFANPHGHVFDAWGQNFVYDGTTSQPFHGTLFSGHAEGLRKHPKPPQLYEQRTRPCSGTEILSSRHFPDELQGNLLVANVIGFLGILQYRFEESGASYRGTEVQPLVQSSDPNFRPSDLEIGPDGALYFADWQNPLIGHMQHHIRDPSRDKLHGRVYRVTCTGRPLLKPAAVAGEPIEKLLRRLEEPEDRVRQRTRIELSGRKTEEVIPLAKKWAEGLDKDEKRFEHHLLEALWLHQSHNVVDEGLLRRLLRSPEPRARAAATRVLCDWRDRVPEALTLLRPQATDEHALVRLEAVRAASFFPTAKAAEIALESVDLPQDEHLKYTLDQTLKTLERYEN
jgi:glucose/arabinose dehydrogenase/lysophospholipase L1-like esterase